MVERGVIRNREYAKQLKDFSGLRYGKITPTDIDGFLDFGDRLFVVVEGKHAGSAIQTGQRLALERLVDACHCPPRRIAVCFIVDHYGGDSDEDVDYASCIVRTVRWNSKWWPQIHKRQSLKDAIDRLKAYSDNLQKNRLRLVKGGAA